MSTIKVTGVGQVSLKPDVIGLKINVSTFSKNYNELLDLHSNKINELINIISSEKINKDELKTVSYYVNPKYENIRNKDNSYKQVLTGYDLNQSFKLEIDYNLTLLENILTKISNTEINPNFSVYFSVKDKSKCMETLLNNAYNDALIKANTLAKVSNKKIKDLISIEDNDNELSFISDTSLSGYKLRANSSVGSIVSENIEEKAIINVVFEII